MNKRKLFSWYLHFFEGVDNIQIENTQGYRVTIKNEEESKVGDGVIAIEMIP